MCGLHSGIFSVGIRGVGKQLHQVGAGQIARMALRVGDLVHSAADEEVAGESARGRVLDHLVDLQLVVPRSRLQEEVVRQVLDEVARGEHVVAVPRAAVASPAAAHPGRLRGSGAGSRRP